MGSAELGAHRRVDQQEQPPSHRDRALHAELRGLPLYQRAGDTLATEHRVSVPDAVYLPLALIAVAYLLGRSAERVARTLRPGSSLGRAALERAAGSEGRRGLPKMTAIARRRGWSEIDLKKHFTQ